jgi:hypothetical protein
MGCDWHCYFDKKTDNGWELVWQPVLDKWWYETIVFRSISNGQAVTAFGIQDEDKLYETIEKYYDAIPLDEANKKFLYHPDAIRDWLYPSNNRTYSVIKSRDYDWFAYMAGVRAYGDNDYLFGEKLRGLPEDAHPLIKMEYELCKEDYHSENWLMVDEVLAKEILKDFDHYKWLKKHIKYPENTRMIFWFDN